MGRPLVRCCSFSTLATCWKQALLGADPDSPTKYDFEGLEPGDFHCALVSSSENNVSGTDVDGWVELDDRHRGYRGYQTVTEEDTADTLHQSAATDKDTGTQGEEPEKLSSIRDYYENIMEFIDLSSDSTLSDYYEHFRAFRFTIVDRRRKRLTRQKIHSCLKPVRSLAPLTFAASPSGSKIPTISAADDFSYESPNQFLERFRIICV